MIVQKNQENTIIKNTQIKSKIIKKTFFEKCISDYPSELYFPFPLFTKNCFLKQHNVIWIFFFEKAINLLKFIENQNHNYLL